MSETVWLTWHEARKYHAVLRGEKRFVLCGKGIGLGAEVVDRPAPMHCCGSCSNRIQAVRDREARVKKGSGE